MVRSHLSNIPEAPETLYRIKNVVLGLLLPKIRPNFNCDPVSSNVPTHKIVAIFMGIGSYNKLR